MVNRTMVGKGYKQNSGVVINEQEQVVKIIEQAITEIEKEIQLQKKRKGITRNEYQLGQIKKELKIMQETLNPQKYVPGYCRAIVDS